MIPILLALSCVPVDGPKLLARHFAAAIPDFSQLALDTQLGHAPAPGIVRAIRAEEVLRIASKHGISASATDICFEWPMKPLDIAHAIETMRDTLPAHTRADVLEVSRAPVPDGVLEFPLERLQGNIWRGSVRYNGAGSGRFDVWARVQLIAKQTRIVTTAPLHTGERLTAAQLRIEQWEGAPLAGLVPTMEAAVGMIAKRTLPAGTVLKEAYVELPPAVRKGDVVRLSAAIGIARVATEALAQAPGRVGDTILVKNSGSGRVIRGRIEAPGQVRLTP